MTLSGRDKKIIFNAPTDAHRVGALMASQSRLIFLPVPTQNDLQRRPSLRGGRWASILKVPRSLNRSPPSENTKKKAFLRCRRDEVHWRRQHQRRVLKRGTKMPKRDKRSPSKKSDQSPEFLRPAPSENPRFKRQFTRYPAGLFVSLFEIVRYRRSAGKMSPCKQQPPADVVFPPPGQGFGGGGRVMGSGGQ